LDERRFLLARERGRESVRARGAVGLVSVGATGFCETAAPSSHPSFEQIAGEKDGEDTAVLISSADSPPSSEPEIFIAGRESLRRRVRARKRSLVLRALASGDAEFAPVRLIQPSSSSSSEGLDPASVPSSDATDWSWGNVRS
jgi:hypothetical protein